MSDPAALDVIAAPDPVAAVLDAHARGGLIALPTSGTTGRPRTVVRTTASWWDSFGAVSDLMGLDTSARLWAPGPLSSTMNLFARVHARVAGAGESELADATHAVLTPTALSRLLDGSVPPGLHVVVAGDRLERALHDRAVAHGVTRVSHYYGAAELSFVAWGSHADDLRVFPGTEVTIDDDDDEVWVRSPYLCTRVDGGRGRLRHRPDGFATVGDLGRLDGDWLTVVGRDDAVVVTAGATVLTWEVEDALEAATGIRPVVLGIPHPALGEILTGCATSADDVATLKQAARRELLGAQRPRRWCVVADFPTTAAGKLDRRRLRDLVVSGAD